MESTAAERAGAATQRDQTYIKEEPVFTDLDWQPTEEIHQIYIKEENFKFEIPEDDNVCDPLQLKKEEKKYEVESVISASERERSQVDDICISDGNGTPATIDGSEAGMGDYVRSAAEWKESFGNQSNTRQLVLGCEKASALLPGPEECRHVDSGHRPLSCSVCYKTFTSKFGLKRHLHLHTGVRPYSCSVCSKSFTQSNHLKEHSLIHTGERPFNCGVCSRTFTQSSSLHQHLLIHTGERPYSCGVCSKTFTQRSALRKHSLLHTGENS